MKTPTPRRTRVLRILATLAFAALVVFGPLTENTGAEKVFAMSVILLALLALLFASARIAFSLIAVSLLFGAIEIAGVLKFRYLTTPLLAPTSNTSSTAARSKCSRTIRCCSRSGSARSR
jgi:hypothetical protein